MIGDSEKNIVYFSDKLPEVAPKTYAEITSVLDRFKVKHMLLKGTKDIWCRDYMPVQTGTNRFISFGYRPDYLLDTPRHRNTITDGYKLAVSSGLGTVVDRRNILIDGGNVISSPNSVIMTSKMFEENPAMHPSELLQELETVFGAKIVLLPWDPAEIYGHSDGIVRFIDDKTVLMTNYAQFDRKMADRFRKVLSTHFRVEELHFDVPEVHRHSWAYINWLQTDSVLVIPGFNIPEDEMAFQQISHLMPSYSGRIAMVDATELIRQEGGLNCASWVVRRRIPSIPAANNTSQPGDAIFPCYGVTIHYSDGRVVKYDYPDGIDDPYPEL